MWLGAPHRGDYSDYRKGLNILDISHSQQEKISPEKNEELTCLCFATYIFHLQAVKSSFSHFMNESNFWLLHKTLEAPLFYI